MAQRSAPAGSTQSYALAVVLERDKGRELYAELRAQLEALVEVEVE